MKPGVPTAEQSPQRDVSARPIETRAVLDAAREGKAIGQAEALHLLQLSNEDDLHRLQETADALRKQQAGDAVAYATGCSLFLTNLCELAPSIYPYPKKPGEPGAYVLSIDDIDAVLELAGSRKTQRILISGGGFWPFLQIPGLEKPTLLKTYGRLVAYVHEGNPNLDIAGFSPDEIDFLAVVADRNPTYVLELLKDQGLQTLGGQGAGILVDAVRQKISPKLSSVKRWFEIVEAAVRLQIPVQATIEAGHFETLAQRAAHLAGIREFLSRHPGAFYAFVPQMLVPNPQAPKNQGEWPGYRQAALSDRRKLLAVTRCMLGPVLSRQTVLWMPDKAEEARDGLQWGADALGGTDAMAYPAFLLGARNPQGLTPEEAEGLIEEAERQPVRQSAGL